MSKDRQWFKMPSKKTILLLMGFALIFILLWLVLSRGYIGASGEKIEFKELSKKEIPNAIEREIIPEYRELERALGCVLDGKVYVVVTRGEMPTAGYEVSIKSMDLENTDEGTNLKVTACFKEPTPGISVAKVSTYPYVVTETNLTKLPKSIELISEYEE